MNLLVGLLLLLPLGQIPDGSAAQERLYEEATAAVVRAAVDTVSPSIVTIETVGGAQPVRRGARGAVSERFKIADGPSTGIILSEDGLIVTSSFNFVREPTVITVRLADDRRLVATLLARDHIRRLALLRVEAGDLHAATWAPREEIALGQYALACGHGLGGSQPFVSLGIVSALGRRNGLAIQTDAKTSPINYGGALIDIDGRVLGLIVPMAGSGGGALAGVDWYDSGIGFAIPRDRIDEVMDRLRRGEDIEPGKIGIVLGPQESGLLDDILDELLPQSRGARITAVGDPSPAKSAGLEPEDLIVALDARPISDLEALLRELSDRAAGERVTLTVKRRWRRFERTITLAKSSDIGPVKAATDTPQPHTEEVDPAEEDDSGEEQELPPTTQPDPN